MRECFVEARGVCLRHACNICDSLPSFGRFYTVDSDGVVHWRHGRPPLDDPIVGPLFRVQYDKLKRDVEQLRERINHKLCILTKMGKV